MAETTLTVMCQDASGKGTIWIDYITCPHDTSLATVMDMAAEKCAEAWERPQVDHNIICMGVAEGKINFWYFDDSHLE